jgi:hypothetical protein
MQKQCVNLACVALAAALHLGPEAAAQEPATGGGEPAGRGARAEVTLDLRDEPPPPPSEPPPLWPVAALGAAGVIGLGVGAGLAIAASAEGSNAQALHDALASWRRTCVTGSASYDARCPALSETARRADALHNAGVGLLIGGGIALAGAGSYLAWHEGEKGHRAPATAVRVAPWAGASGAGLRAEGWF